MKTTNKTEEIIKEEKISPRDVFIDAIGIGSGVANRLKEKGYPVNAVKVGEKAQNQKDYSNIKAEAFWEAAKWLREGGALDEDEDWGQLTEIKYKEDADKRTKFIGKEELRLKGISPDTPESFMLTFAPREPEIPRALQDKQSGGLKPFYPTLGF